MNDFLTALVSGGEIHPDFEDGLKNQKVLHAVEKASRSRRWEQVV